MAVSETFKNSITMWAELTDKKAAVMTDMRKINKKLSDLKSYITAYMDENNFDVCNVKGSKVTLSRNNTKEVLNKDSLHRLISEYPGLPTKDDKFIFGLVDHIINNRQTRQTLNLKRATIPGYSYAVKEFTERGNDAEDAVSSAAEYASKFHGANSARDDREEVEENDVGDDFE